MVRPAINYTTRSPLFNYLRALRPHVLTYLPPFPLHPPPFSLQSVMSLGPSHVDVLIVGAGPAGLMCANALVRAGVNVRVIDRRCPPFYHRLDFHHSRPPCCRPIKVAAGQADGIQPRTIEVLQASPSLFPSNSQSRTHTAYRINTELWPCRPPSESSSNNDHGCQSELSRI